MDIPWKLILHHLILLFLCLLIMINRYINRKWKNTFSLILNLFIALLIVHIGISFGITKAFISIFLYLIYMIIMNKITISLVEKIDKSTVLLDELKKKIKKQ